MKLYEKPMIETVLFDEKTYVLTISTLPEPGENEMPLN